MATHHSFSPDPLKELSVNPLSLQKSMNSDEVKRNKNLPMNMEKLKKPENLSFIKREAEKNFLNDEKYDQQRFEFFFRFRISSLIKVLGFEKYYKNDNIVKGGKKIEMKKKQKNDSLKNLRRLVVTKSKYRFKDKIDFLRAAILKSIEYDAKLKISTLQVTDKIDDDLESDEENKIPSKNEKDTNPPVKQNSSDLEFEYQLWKKRNHYPPDVKIFIIIGEYRDMREDLLKRNWIENPDKTSLFFDFMWTTKAGDIDYENARPTQIVNHYQKNGAITTKGGLCRNIRNLIGFNLIDVDSFYPRCFELNDTNDFDDFIEDYKLTKAEAFLKKAVIPNNEQPNNFEIIKYNLCLDLLTRKYKNIFTTIDDILDKKFPIVNEFEWKILTTEGNIAKEECDNILQKLKYVDFILDKDELIKKINTTFDKFKIINPQYYLNGPNAIWILKPAGLSRGRGVKCFESIEKILDSIIMKDIRWVAQKYIENPLIIKNRKFDIRQWAAVGDWNSQKVYFYEEFYIRFCAEDYNPYDLKNKFMHLSNNSIAKHSDKFYNSAIEGNMWTMKQFSDHLFNLTGSQDTFNNIRKKMKQIVLRTVKSAEEIVINRKNTFEHFGYDFMIDDNFTPWLIEINSSPAVDYSTHITERLVKKVSEDIVNLLVDKQISENNGWECL